MVDFDSGQTVSTPPSDVIKITIIQRTEDILNALEQYYKFQATGSDTSGHIIKARVRILWIKLRPAFKRWMSKEEFSNVEKVFNLDNNNRVEVESYVQIYHKINEYLDTKLITRIDNRSVRSTLDPEAENEEKEM